MKWGNDELHYMRAFEQISRVTPKDCIVGKNGITFLVPEKDMGQAIGKAGITIQLAREKMGKKVEVLAFEDDPALFVKKALYFVKFEDVEVRESGEKRTLMLMVDSENRRKLENSGGKLKKLKEIVHRNYSIDDIRTR
ncbi:MAG: NusA-like transcription termination signal-binding factor [Candidatus Diapherotrites archaeon]